MGPDRGMVREISWPEVAPWLLLFRAVPLAFDLRKVLLATVGLVLTWAGWWGLAYAFAGSNRPDVQEQVRYYRDWLAAPPPAAPAVDERDPASSGRLAAGLLHLGRDAWNSLLDVPWRLSRPFRDLFSPRASLPGWSMSAACAIWALAVWSLFGGAVSRIAAGQLAQERRISMAAAVMFAVRRFPAYFLAPLFPFVLVLLGLIPLSLAGLLTRFDAGYAVAAIAWPLLLIVGGALAVLLIGLFIGWPLMWGAVSTEGNDAFDAFNRLYAYVYQRAFHLAAYVLLAAALGVAALAAARILAAAALFLTAWGVSWGAGPAREVEIFVVSQLHNLDAPDAAGGRILTFWVTLVGLLVIGFGHSYFWTAATAIYQLLRWDADATPLDVLHVEAELDERPLPEMVKDAAGVPVLPEETPPDSEPGGASQGASVPSANNPASATTAAPAEPAPNSPADESRP